MAAQPKEYFDIETAQKKDSYRIDRNAIAPAVLASRFRKISLVEKFFYLSLIVASLTIAVALLYVKTKTLEVEGVTVNLTQTNAAKQTKNSELDQQLQDLSSNTRVANVATKDGLTIDYNNVLKASK